MTDTPTIERDKAAAQAFVCESQSGWKVVVANVPYGELSPDNIIVVKDGMRRDDAIRLRIEVESAIQLMIKRYGKL